jgi:hypothetical protein
MAFVSVPKDLSRIKSKILMNLSFRQLVCFGAAISDLIAKLSHQKSEAKHWEGNYNNLYRQHVQLKRSKGLEIE